MRRLLRAVEGTGVNVWHMILWAAAAGVSVAVFLTAIAAMFMVMVAALTALFGFIDRLL